MACGSVEGTCDCLQSKGHGDASKALLEAGLLQDVRCKDSIADIAGLELIRQGLSSVCLESIVHEGVRIMEPGVGRPLHDFNKF